MQTSFDHVRCDMTSAKMLKLLHIVWIYRFNDFIESCCCFFFYLRMWNTNETKTSDSCEKRCANCKMCVCVWFKVWYTKYTAQNDDLYGLNSSRNEENTKNMLRQTHNPLFGHWNGRSVALILLLYMLKWCRTDMITSVELIQFKITNLWKRQNKKQKQ